jgi:hypothetical protein
MAVALHAVLLRAFNLAFILSLAFDPGGVARGWRGRGSTKTGWSISSHGHTSPSLATATASTSTSWSG